MQWLLLLGLLTQAGGEDLLRLAEARAGDALPPGWEQRGVRGRSAPVSRILATSDGTVLEIAGQGAAAWFYRRLAREQETTGRRLTWDWRVLRRPEGADLSRKDRDDSPLRIIVAFGEFGRGRMIFYSWGGAEAAGLDQPSFANKRWHVIAVQGAASSHSGWSRVQVNPAEDYRRTWGAAAPPVSAVGLFQDTDQTGGRAVAQIRSLSFSEPPGGHLAAPDPTPSAEPLKR